MTTTESIPELMAAAVFHGRGDGRIEQRPVPVPGAGQALVRVLRSGICGTDATEYKSGPIMFPIDRPHPISGHLGPLVIGCAANLVRRSRPVLTLVVAVLMFVVDAAIGGSFAIVLREFVPVTPQGKPDRARIAGLFIAREQAD